MPRILFLTIFVLVITTSYSFAGHRIVSLAPNVTEILFEIGLGKQVVGVTDSCNYPPITKDIPEVGSYYRPSIEKILMLKPSFVIGMKEGYTKRLKYKLDELGVGNRFFEVDKYEDIVKMIDELGKMFNKSTENLRGKIEYYFDSDKSYSDKSAVFLINAKPAYVVGGDNFVNDILGCAGLKNLLASSKNDFPQINYEKIFQLNPDFIILAKRHGTSQADSFFYEKIRSAGKNAKVLEVQSDIFLRPSYRIIDACKILRKLIK